MKEGECPKINDLLQLTNYLLPRGESGCGTHSAEPPPAAPTDGCRRPSVPPWGGTKRIGGAQRLVGVPRGTLRVWGTGEGLGTPTYRVIPSLSWYRRHSAINGSSLRFTRWGVWGGTPQNEEGGSGEVPRRWGGGGFFGGKTDLFGGEDADGGAVLAQSDPQFSQLGLPGMGVWGGLGVWGVSGDLGGLGIDLGGILGVWGGFGGQN